MKTLETYGWDEERAAAWSAEASTGHVPARVIADHGHRFKIAAPEEHFAQLTGSAMHKSTSNDMPKIGDWVAVELKDNEPAIIHAVLPRKSEVVRGHVGRQIDKQVIAANVDLAFIVQPLDHDFSPERLERYIFQLASQHISVIILLNKADQAHDAAEKAAQLKDLAAEIRIISALHDTDLSQIEQFITPGKTAVIMGSSGAGKSTLTNRLLGADVQATAPIREKDSKGRHTTVHRELFVLPGGGMIIDTPGIRELQLWGDAEDLEHLFPEIITAIRACHYPHCAHVTEDRCQIKSGLADGTIDPNRYRIYQSFKGELDALESKREFIAERRDERTKESAKRRLQRRRSREQYRPTLDD